MLCWIARKAISTRRQGGRMGGIPQLAVFFISILERDLALGAQPLLRIC